MKSVSIIIAAFQARRWLGDCLESVFSQALPPGWRLQVLVGVDGCADTLDYINTVHHPALHKVYLRRNRGTYVTFNTLMQYAEGELFARFDADDVMLDDCLAEHIDLLNNGADMCSAWSVYTDEHLRPTSIIPAHPNYRPEGGKRRDSTDGQFVAKRCIWQQLGGFRPWPCGADTDFVIRTRAAGFKVSVLEKFLYLRRTHAMSLTTHPATNFESNTRMQLQEMTIAYRKEYMDGLRPVKVETEIEPEHIPPGQFRNRGSVSTMDAPG